MSTPEVDLTIVGGGVVGCAVADAAARAGRAVVLLEQEPALARGTTSRNSEVAHGGMYYRSGSLKARFCVEGRHLLRANNTLLSRRLPFEVAAGEEARFVTTNRSSWVTVVFGLLGAGPLSVVLEPAEPAGVAAPPPG